MQQNERVTAALVLIGNELLSGRVADENMHYIARRLVAIGITLVEVRVIPDDCEVIASTVRTLKDQCDYVFTTGGIGPTHDDITAECIARAFNRPLIQHPRTAAVLRELFAARGVEANAERMRMANMPEGAEPVEHEHSPVPGFRMDNVFVLAGVPSVMRSMLEGALPLLRTGAPVLSISLRCDLQEGTLAKPLGEIQQSYPEVDIGSYPLSRKHDFHVALVVRGVDRLQLQQVAEQIERLIQTLGGTVILREDSLAQST